MGGGYGYVEYLVLKAPFAVHAGWAVVQVVLTANIWLLYPDRMGSNAIDNQLCVAIVSLVVLSCAAILGSVSQSGTPWIPLIICFFLAAVTTELHTCADGCKKPDILHASLAFACQFGTVLCACMFCIVGIQNVVPSSQVRDRKFC